MICDRTFARIKILSPACDALTLLCSARHDASDDRKSAEQKALVCLLRRGYGDAYLHTIPPAIAKRYRELEAIYQHRCSLVDEFLSRFSRDTSAKQFALHASKLPGKKLLFNTWKSAALPCAQYLAGNQAEAEELCFASKEPI